MAAAAATAAAVAALTPAVALAQNSGAAAPDGGRPGWELYVAVAGVLLAVAATVNLFLSIREKLRPRPPLAEQFAPIRHDHAEFVRLGDYKLQHDEALANRRTDARQAAADREAIQRQIDHLATELRAGFGAQESRNEQRAKEVHNRINAIAEPLNQWIGRVQSHINDGHIHGSRT